MIRGDPDEGGFVCGLLGQAASYIEFVLVASLSRSTSQGVFVRFFVSVFRFQGQKICFVGKYICTCDSEKDHQSLAGTLIHVKLFSTPSSQAETCSNWC